MTIPDEAVQAAAKAMIDISKTVSGHHQSHIDLFAPSAIAALTAALPFLQGVKVLDDAIVQPLEDIHTAGGLCKWTDVATAIGEVRRLVYAIEPSPSPRAQALEEAALLNEAKELAFTAISRMRAAHVSCLDLTLQAEKLVGNIAAAIRALSSQPVADGCKGEWREIEYNHSLKGRRLNPAYFPSTGEVCEISGPNCDDDKGYTWGETTVLWQNEMFVLYGKDGYWPVLHKHEHVLFRPLPASPGASE
jgi:hypothetical protein